MSPKPGIVAGEALTAWFDSNGGHFDTRCSVSKTNRGIAISTSAPISVEELATICTCPISLSLSYLNVLQSGHLDHRPEVRHVESVASALVGSIPPHVISWFVLAEQRLLGTASFWSPYIEALPKESELTTPIWFNEDDMRWIAGTNLAAAKKTREEEWKAEMQKALSVLHQQGVSAQPYTWDLVAWAATIFSSRSFTPRGIWADNSEDFRYSLLFPVIDLFNHDHSSKVTWRFDGGNFTITSNQSFAAGSEICNNYGPKSNEELLLGYGFCIPNNPYDALVIQIRAPSVDFLAALCKTHPAASLIALLQAPPLFHLHGPSNSAPSFHIQKGEFLNDFDQQLLNILADMVLYRSNRLPITSVPTTTTTALSGRLALSIFRQIQPWFQMRAHQPQAFARQHDLREPTNAQQTYAQIYRDSQIRIASAYLAAYESTLRSLSAPESDTQACRLVSFSQISRITKTSLPALHRTWSRGVKAAYGSSTPARLRQSGCDDDAFILLLAAVYHDVPELPNTVSTVHSWLAGLRSAYPNPPPASHTGPTKEYFAPVLTAVQSSDDSAESFWHAAAFEHAVMWASWIFQHEAWEWSEDADAEGAEWWLYVQAVDADEEWWREEA